jgi:DNA modification methylase
MTWRVITGDCVEVMRGMAAGSVDAIVCDPPYELGFMGKKWDASGIAYSVEMWREALRVLKPGGHLLAFGGTRTYHRMACAIEDAGFEIRDSLHWIYGSGFPKSLNVSKAIGEKPEAERWDGWGTALKPAHEPIVMARKPLVGTVAENVLEYGVGAINIDACRVEPTVSLTFEQPSGRWPPNLILTHSAGCDPGGDCARDCPVAELDRQSGPTGACAPVRGSEPSSSTKNVYGKRARVPGAFHGASGGASRFFPCFRYVAKPSRTERDAGCEDLPLRTGGEATDRQDGTAGLRSPRAGAGRTGGARNYHPTVKPVALVEWLVQLVTPPGGVVLDPFLGSGTTGCAAVRLGFDFIGVEKEAEYVRIAEKRIALAAAAPRTKALDELDVGDDPLPGQMSFLSGERTGAA